VEALVQGTATAAQRDRLEARLAAEPSSRWFYVAYLDLHAHLQWTTRGEAAPPRDAQEPPSRGNEVPAPGRRVGARSRWALAAAVALAVGLAAALVSRPGAEDEEAVEMPPVPAGSVAVLIDAKNAVWEDDMVLPTAAGSALPPGRLKLRAGVVEVAFNAGGGGPGGGAARVEVQARARGSPPRGER